jgi:hypothetical protein
MGKTTNQSCKSGCGREEMHCRVGWGRKSKIWYTSKTAKTAGGNQVGRDGAPPGKAAAGTPTGDSDGVLFSDSAAALSFPALSQFGTLLCQTQPRPLHNLARQNKGNIKELQTSFKRVSATCWQKRVVQAYA